MKPNKIALTEDEAISNKMSFKNKIFRQYCFKFIQILVFYQINEVINIKLFA